MTYLRTSFLTQWADDTAGNDTFITQVVCTDSGALKFSWKRQYHTILFINISLI